MKRRGWSLIEVIVVMAVGSVVLGTASTLLYTIMRAERAARHEIERRAVLGRLADQFRSDAHAATRCEAIPAEGGNKSQPGWQFDLPSGESVVYENGPDGLLRTERIGQAVQRRETFSLPAETTAEIEIHAADRPRLVSLLIVPSDDVAAQPQLESVQIEALLGSDHRFVKKEEP